MPLNPLDIRNLATLIPDTVRRMRPPTTTFEMALWVFVFVVAVGMLMTGLRP